MLGATHVKSGADGRGAKTGSHGEYSVVVHKRSILPTTGATHMLVEPLP